MRSWRWRLLPTEVWGQGCRLLGACLSFMYPDRCQLCGGERATAKEGYVCGRCWEGRDGVRFIRPPRCERCGLPFAGEVTTAFECSNCRELDLQFSHARAAVVAKGVALEVIHRYKYHRALWFEPFLADLLVRAAGPELAAQKWDWLVPIPLYPTKQREREFNQAERLAARLSRASGIRLNTRLIRRVQATRTQTLLTRTERIANMRHAFAIRPGRSVADLKIVLIDDVLTTGATASACARVLRTNGASDVCVWTVARGV